LLYSAPPLNSKVDVRFLGSAAGGGGGGSGTNGTSGSSGSSGTSGTSGSSGESGTSGSSGESGTSGSSGSSGESGTSGSSGTSGTSGSSGESGTSGSSGTSGTSGSSGESGTSGSSGSSISLQTGSLYPITASRAITASYALNATGGGSSLSRAITASYALNASGGGGSTLQTGSTYPITSSYANFAINIAGSVTTLVGTDINWNNPTYEKNISVAETYTFSNVTTGSSIVVILNNTGSNSILSTFPNSVKWANSLPPTNILSNATSIYTFVRTKLYVLGSSTENYQ